MCVRPRTLFAKLPTNSSRQLESKDAATTSLEAGAQEQDARCDFVVDVVVLVCATRSQMRAGGFAQRVGRG